MQQILPQVYLKYKAVAINFLRVLCKTRVYQNRTVLVSETNIFVYYWDRALQLTTTELY